MSSCADPIGDHEFLNFGRLLPGTHKSQKRLYSIDTDTPFVADREVGTNVCTAYIR